MLDIRCRWVPSRLVASLSTQVLAMAFVTDYVAREILKPAAEDREQLAIRQFMARGNLGDFGIEAVNDGGEYAVSIGGRQLRCKSLVRIALLAHAVGDAIET